MELARPEKFGAAPTVLADKRLSPRRLPGQPQWIPLKHSPPAAPGLESPQWLFGQRVLERELTLLASRPCIFLPTFFRVPETRTLRIATANQSHQWRIDSQEPDEHAV